MGRRERVGAAVLRGACALVAAAFATVSASPAVAADAHVTARLEWQRAAGAEDCIASDALERGVEARLARSVFVQSGSSDVIVHGAIEPRPGSGFRARLEMVTPSGQSLGTREIETTAPHCSALDDSLALVVALMVDVPPEELPPAELPHAQPPPAPRPAPRPSTPIAVPRATHAPRAPWRFEADANMALGFGMLPDPAAGIAASLAIEPPSFVLTELEGRFWFPQSVETGGAGADFSLVSVGLFLCPLAFGDPLTVRVCAGQEVGRIGVSGFGFDHNRDRAPLVYDLGAFLRASLPLTGLLGIQGRLGAAVPFSRDRFVYSAADGSKVELFRAWLVLAAAELGIELHFR